MRRLLMLLCAAGILYLAVDVGRRALRTPEERIRRVVAAMAAAFDAGSPGGAVRGLAPEWRDAGSGVTREDLRLALARFFLTDGRDAATRALAWRVEVPDAQLEVALDPDDPARATIAGAASFYERRGAAERLGWELAFEGRLERQDAGWRIVSTTTRTVSGRRP